MATNPERTIHGPFLNERQRGMALDRNAGYRAKEERHKDALVPIIIRKFSRHGRQIGDRLGYTEADVVVLEAIGWVERL